MKYFSDKEMVRKGHITFTISKDVWNGIAVCVNSLIGNNLLAKDYPRRCPDGNGICGVDEHVFYIAACAVINGIKEFLPQYGDIEYILSDVFNSCFDTQEEIEEKKKSFTYDVLDFIEFTYKHIYDVQNDVYHDYFRHYELKFPNTTNERIKFVSDINELFERNNIGFRLLDDGTISRCVEDNLLPQLPKQNDAGLEDLIQEALERFKKPKFNERKIALEKLWDAFERLKSREHDTNKKQSVEILLYKASLGNVSFNELLNNESHALTNIGNQYQIRHFEQNKKEIESEPHIDYLFYRLYSLINLILATT